MSLIAKVQENIVSRGLGGSESLPAEENACETVFINLEQVVTIEEEFYPLTGIFADVPGWKWNKTIAQSFDNIRQRIESSIGGYEYNLDEGSTSLDWYGSALSGLKLLQIEEFQDITKRTGWKPLISKGSYSIFHKSKALNSKACISKILSENVILEEQCLENSLQINLFKRDRNLNNIPYLQYKAEFSTIDKYYFFFEENEIFISEVFEKKIGSSVLDKESIECHSEYLGVGKPGRSICYTEYFPFKDIEVVSIVEDNIYEWVRVESFKDSNENERHYLVDDLSGKIVFPKKASESKFYVKADNGNTIEFFNETSSLPQEGKLIINGVEVEYYSKGKYKVYCASSRVANFERGIFATEKQLGKTLTVGEKIYCNYTAVPRVDYDVVDTYFEDFNINLKPYKKINSNGILELDIDEKNVNSIKLSCDKPIIVKNIYGPLFVQSDATRVSAEVFNSNGKEEEEIKVFFECSEGDFEGTGKKITKVTNLNGVATTSYQYQYTDNALQTFANPKQINNSSYFEINNLPPGINTEDIVVFQSLKTDPFYGSLGSTFEVEDIEQEGKYLRLTLNKEILDSHEYKTLYTQQYASEDGSGFSTKEELNRDLCLNGYYNYGLAILEYEGLIKKSAIIRGAEKNQILIEGLEDNFLIPSSVRLYKRSELVFSQEQEKFHDRILYEYDSESISYKPIKPTRIVGNRLYFDGTLIPEGSLTNNETMIAGYKIFFPQLVSIKAYATNPASGFLISSNEIKIKVDFPSYLKGSNGFTFITDEIEEGSALGGANFLTINPEIPNVLNIIVE
jgi:hypothetical protein